jgi:signal transduction histidine kinase
MGRIGPTASCQGAPQALQGKQAKALVQYRDNDTGEGAWILIRANPIFDLQGQVQFVITVSTDLTEQKELEQRKDHFISMASHELKTPLTVLSAYAQVLRERLEADHFLSDDKIEGKRKFKEVENHEEENTSGR